MTTTLRDLFRIVRLEYGLAKGFRIRSVIVLFRLASYAYHGQSIMRYAFGPIAVLYKLYTEYLLGIELPASTRIGAGLRIYHGVGLVVHKDVQIGTDCVLRHGVTIGNKGEDDPTNLLPRIGNNVRFGAGAIIIGAISVGNNSTIGAGTVVTKNIPPNSVVVGSGFHILETKS